ncbi:MAG TPA: acyltransferase, partial [Holophaga sp.]|nr:acyltransferase [Holophaga sp.]
PPMSPVSFVAPAFILLLALGSSYAFAKAWGVPGDQGRIPTIDGLRGYLALFVFMHHASFWYCYLHTGRWSPPPSNLYNHFGQTSVAMFFMVTAFLFHSKLLDHPRKPIDWPRLITSRLCRLLPLYFLAVTIMSIVVFALSGWALVQPKGTLVSELLHWYGFTIAGESGLNGLDARFVRRIMAGVAWTLPYEWLFYASLPLLARCLRIKIPNRYLLLDALLVLALLFVMSPRPILLWIFVGGIAAAVVARSLRFRQFSRTGWASLIAIACLVVNVCIDASPFHALNVMLLSIAFALIASGSDLFGILSTRCSFMLGNITYSLYLLHGLLLFILFRFILGFDLVRSFSPMAYWLTIAGVTPVLVGMCYLSFMKIELPALNLAGPIVHRCRALKARLSGLRLPVRPRRWQEGQGAPSDRA